MIKKTTSNVPGTALSDFLFFLVTLDSSSKCLSFFFSQAKLSSLKALMSPPFLDIHSLKNTSVNPKMAFTFLWFFPKALQLAPPSSSISLCFSHILSVTLPLSLFSPENSNSLVLLPPLSFLENSNSAATKISPTACSESSCQQPRYLSPLCQTLSHTLLPACTNGQPIFS